MRYVLAKLANRSRDFSRAAHERESPIRAQKKDPEISRFCAMVFSLPESPLCTADTLGRKSNRGTWNFLPGAPRHAATRSANIPGIPACLAIVRQLFDGPYFVRWRELSAPSRSSFAIQCCSWFARLKPRLRSGLEWKEASYYRQNWDGVIKRRSRTARIIAKAASPNAPVIHLRSTVQIYRVPCEHRHQPAPRSLFHLYVTCSELAVIMQEWSDSHIVSKKNEDKNLTHDCKNVNSSEVLRNRSRSRARSIFFSLRMTSLIHKKLVKNRN